MISDVLLISPYQYQLFPDIVGMVTVGTVKNKFYVIQHPSRLLTKRVGDKLKVSVKLGKRFSDWTKDHGGISP